MRSTRAVPVVVMAMILTACPRPAEQQAVAPATWQQDAQDGFQQLQDAYNRGDAVALANLFTDNAVLMPPDGPRVAGRNAIQEFYQREFAAPAMQQPAGAAGQQPGTPQASPQVPPQGAGAPQAPDPVPAPAPGVPPAPGTPGAQPPGDQPPGAQPPASDVPGTLQQPGAQQQPQVGQQPGMQQQPMPGMTRLTGSIESSAAVGEWGWTSGDLQMNGGTAGAVDMKFVAVSRQGGDGVWRIHRLIWNRSTGGTLDAAGTGTTGGPTLGTQPGTGAPGRQ
jgi:ketosteroid isomerase-like protein